MMFIYGVDLDFIIRGFTQYHIQNLEVQRSVKRRPKKPITHAHEDNCFEQQRLAFNLLNGQIS